MRVIKNLGVATILVSLAACNTLERLEEVGTGPKLEQQKSPTLQAGYQPVSNWPTPVEPVNETRSANSLWQPGARSFFKDQRATRVGDILTVVVQIADTATLSNNTARKRTNSESLAAPMVLGMQEEFVNWLPGKQDADNLLELSGNSNTTGGGQIGRSETITTKIAASITQVLGNGNLVVKGKQQVRVNFEMREITVEGVIRPEDISSDNTILSEQMAEARISYGGRGTVSDVQQPRYGNQIIDIISPF